jgi:hypothetical protein
VVNERPDVVVTEKVVPAGGFTKPIEAKRILEELNPFRTNPLPF